jgi:glycerophosphoryl diester phosphodiesterase
MRSSRSRPDPLDPGPLGFAHRGLHFGSAVPENSLEAFHEALELGAGIECDLRLTADDRIVLFHDADT